MGNELDEIQGKTAQEVRAERKKWTRRKKKRALKKVKRG